MLQERREIEKALLNGDILGVAATNALELGVDVGGLDMTMHLGFQGDHLLRGGTTADLICSNQQRCRETL